VIRRFPPPKAGKLAGYLAFLFSLAGCSRNNAGRRSYYNKTHKQK